MDYEIQREVDYIIEEVENHQYGSDDGKDKVRQAVRAIGRGDQKTIKSALIYYERECDRRGL